MHKIVNGKRVECSDDEAQKIMTEWAYNKVKGETERKKYLEEQENAKNLRVSAIKKLTALGLSQEEALSFIK